MLNEASLSNTIPQKWCHTIVDHKNGIVLSGNHEGEPIGNWYNVVELKKQTSETSTNKETSHMLCSNSFAASVSNFCIEIENKMKSDI